MTPTGTQKPLLPVPPPSGTLPAVGVVYVTREEWEKARKGR